MEHSAGKAPRMKQRIALLGSTGSIGVQTLDIVRENSELFEITTLTAHRNWEALARQAEEFAPDSVVIADDSKVNQQAVDNAEGAKGNFQAAGQLQIIYGTGTVNKVYDEFIKLGNIKEATKEEAKEAVARGEDLT